MADKVIRIALLGAWHVHTNKFLDKLKPYADQGRMIWEAVWDTDIQRGMQFAKRLGCAFEPEYQAVLDNPFLDAVVIEAQTCMHTELLIMAASKGIHCFSDKILCMNQEEGRKIEEIFSLHPELLFVVSHESLGNPVYRYAKKLMEAGKIGAPVSYYFRRAHGRAKDGTLPQDWLCPDTQGGGALIDLGIHGITLAMYLVGDLEDVSGYMENITGQKSEDSVSLLARTKNGCLVMIHSDVITTIQEQYMEIIGTKGILTIAGAEGEEILSLNSEFLPESKGKMKQLLRRETKEDFYYPIQGFIDVLLGTAEKKAVADYSLAEALKVVKVVEAMYRKESSISHSFEPMRNL